MGWLLLLTGVAVAATGVTLATGTLAVSRVELYRWISHRLRRAGSAAPVLAIPGRLLGAAGGIATVGILLAAFGLMASTARLPLWLGAVTVLVAAIPILLTVVCAVPRALGQRWAEPIVENAVPWLDRLSTLSAPLVLAGTDARPRTALAAFLGSDEESLDTAELITVLLGVLSFTERPVREIITPRTDIVAIREGAKLDEVGQMFAEGGYSRVPVYRDSLDNIIGMIYALDLLKVAPRAELPLRPVAVAPASKPCADLLFEMQRDRRQFAVVLDEYGGTAGIATFQDLLAELVGEIFPDAEGRGNGKAGVVEVAEVTGATPCDEIEARFDIALPSQAETVGGLLARTAGRIPQSGERYVIAELEFDVLAATPTRVERVVVRRGPVPTVHLGGGR
jgi:CBS domain containing-hemolysin-like protein